MLGTNRRTPEERRILENWPTVTAEDIGQMNDLFPHYLFFRPDSSGVSFHTSCCGHCERLKLLKRTQVSKESRLLSNLEHNREYTCPWCGRSVTMKDLRKAGKRKSLRTYRCAVLLHAGENALYADAVVLQKSYEMEADLTANPWYLLSSMYRFTAGDAMEVDYQECERGWITHERNRLGPVKLVQEPFKSGAVSWYQHRSYFILGRQAVQTCPVTRYCHYFDIWRPKAEIFSDFISYMTAFSVYPRQIEMLARSGLREPITALITSRKKFAEVIHWENVDVRKAMDLTAPELREVIAHKTPMLALELRNLARRWFRKTWTVMEAEAYLRAWGKDKARYVLRFCRRFNLDPGRLERYLENQCVVDADLPWLDLRDIFDLYLDYMEAAYELGQCIGHSQVLFPQDLQQAHDRAVGELAARHDAEIAALPPEKQLRSREARMAKYCFELDGLQIVFPQTAASIRYEGKVLRHCVGGYAKRHLEGVLTILFLRKCAAPDRPYVTVEMCGNSIGQVHGYGNDRGRESPLKTHREFFDVWLAWLKAGSRRDEDGTPILPRRKGAVSIA